MANDKASNSDSSWGQYQNLVMRELDRLAKQQGAIEERIVAHDIAIATLMIKAGVWGAGAGLIPAVAALALMALKQSGN